MENIKAVLIPLYLPGINDREKGELATQMGILKEMYADEAEFLDPQPIGTPVPKEADAVVFPQLVGEIYSKKDELKKINLPMIVLTSAFGSVEMWDWEIVTFFREEVGLNIFSPYTVDLAKAILRAVACKKSMKNGVRFLMFQDDPGEGMQANIFKKFYWWEKECTTAMEAAFGLHIIYRSYKELNEQARAVSDSEADAASADWDVPREGVSEEAFRKVAKLYVALKRAIKEVGGVSGIGANCLNESFHSDTTPCLAWNMLYEKDGILWACEGDTITMISKFILYYTLRQPMMMTNIYPFLMGMAALKHEKIDKFPEIPNFENHALGVHCGYFGFAPQSFCSSWVLKPKVLAIVNDDALMVDCRMAEGPVTLAKIHAGMDKITAIQAEITGYVQYPGSDCLNGALIHYKNENGHKIMDSLSSHHELIIQGDQIPYLTQVCRVFGFELEIL